MKTFFGQYDYEDKSDIKRAIRDVKQWCANNELDDNTTFIFKYGDNSSEQYETTLYSLVHELTETYYEL